MKTALQELIDKYKAIPTPMNAMTAKIKDSVIRDLEAALEKEKQQIIDAWDKGEDNWLNSPQRPDSDVIYTSGEEYFTRNFIPQSITNK